VLTVTYQFNPGSSGQFQQPPQPGMSISGGGYSGTVTSYVCDKFGSATSVTHTFTLQDAQGHLSNTVSITFDRPTGSNVAPPSVSPETGASWTTTSGGADVPTPGETPRSQIPDQSQPLPSRGFVLTSGISERPRGGP
jgi:hypothetical protein